jgi:methyltransferase (TIGR00027 family)
VEHNGSCTQPLAAGDRQIRLLSCQITRHRKTPGGFSVEASKVSATALITAYARAYHATHDTPKIFDDCLAAQILTEEERAFFGQNLAQALGFFDPELAASCPDQATALDRVMKLQSAPITISRARYTEDCLELAVNQGVEQYVILGAGMETFAFRQPEMMKRLHVFEVDHPATQAFKQSRLAELGWKIPARLNFVPVDFSKESLAEALRRSSYNPQKVAFFSWLGVTYYLAKHVVLDTLRTITDIAPVGSMVVFDYVDSEAFVPEKAAKRMQLMQAMVQRVGEPMKASFDPSTLGNDLENIGLRLKENLSPSAIEARYFQNRTDGYHAFEHVHFAWAIVGRVQCQC